MYSTAPLITKLQNIKILIGKNKSKIEEKLIFTNQEFQISEQQRSSCLLNKINLNFIQSFYKNVGDVVEFEEIKNIPGCLLSRFCYLFLYTNFFISLPLERPYGRYAQRFSVVFFYRKKMLIDMLKRYNPRNPNMTYEIKTDNTNLLIQIFSF